MALAKTPRTIKAANAVIYTASGGITVSSSATLLSLFSTIFARAKNIEITPPKGDVVLTPLLGETSNFQNFIWDEKPWEAAKMTGTIAFNSSAEDFEAFVVGGGTAVVTATYTRYQYGSSESAKTRVKTGALLVHFKDGSALRSIALDNVYFTSLGPVRATGPDGQMERDFELVCAPEDYWDEFKD